MEWCTSLWNRATVYKRMTNEGWIHQFRGRLVISNQGINMIHDALRSNDYWKMSNFMSQVVEMGYKVIMMKFFNRHVLVCYFTRLRVLKISAYLNHWC
jgi:vacuolar-type H+-ATPase subunit C/Vma6